MILGVRFTIFMPRIRSNGCANACDARPLQPSHSSHGPAVHRLCSAALMRSTRVRVLPKGVRSRSSEGCPEVPASVQEGSPKRKGLARPNSMQTRTPAYGPRWPRRKKKIRTAALRGPGTRTPRESAIVGYGPLGQVS